MNNFQNIRLNKSKITNIYSIKIKRNKMKAEVELVKNHLKNNEFQIHFWVNLPFFLSFLKVD